MRPNVKKRMNRAMRHWVICMKQAHPRATFRRGPSLCQGCDLRRSVSTGILNRARLRRWMAIWNRSTKRCIGRAWRRKTRCAKMTEGPFKPRAESTLQARARRGRIGAAIELERRRRGHTPENANAKPLIDTGQLRKSITYVVRKKSK